MRDERVMRIEADCDIAVPARILDLLSTQVGVPAAFSFRTDAGGMDLSLRFDSLPDAKRGVLLGKIRRVQGVRAVTDQPLAFTPAAALAPAPLASVMP